MLGFLQIDYNAVTFYGWRRLQVFIAGQYRSGITETLIGEMLPENDIKSELLRKTYFSFLFCRSDIIEQTRQPLNGVTAYRGGNSKMRKYVFLIGVFVITLLMSGCGNKQELAQKTTAGGEVANTLGDLIKKQSKVTSYILVGPMKSKLAVKLNEGKPVATRLESEQGWLLKRLDKKMNYIYDQATKSITAMSIAGFPNRETEPVSAAADALKALADSKVSSETVDGVECMKVSNADGSKVYWLEKEHGLPLQLKSDGQNLKFKYEQINSVPDSMFELPAGTKIREMSNMRPATIIPGVHKN